MLVVGLGLAIIYLIIYPKAGVGDIFLAILLYILCGFFGILIAPFILYIRAKKGPKYRRRFLYCLIGTTNFSLALLSFPYVIKIKEKQVPAMFIIMTAFLTGAFILIDIFFGKRQPKPQREYLSM
jgi:hypothetical protein